MIPLTLAEVAAAVGSAPGPADGDAAITVDAPVVTDSRTVEPGGLFAAVAGARVDGHDFLGAVLDAGAAGALIDAAWVGTPAHAALLAERPGAAARLVPVPDVVRALGDLAREVLARVRAAGAAAGGGPRVVAITGSVGKTTTKDLLAQVLRDHVAGELAGAVGEAVDPAEAVISPPGSFNNEIGLPLTVLRTTARSRFLVLEMGADHVGNIADLTSIAPPDVAVVLAVGRAHLGEFGGIEQVARAKAEMVPGAAPGATVVLNADDARVAAMASLAGPGSARPDLRVRTVGRAAADVAARDVRVDDGGRARFDLLDAATGESTAVSLRLVGEHHTANALAAAAAALALGVPATEIAATLARTGPASAHRMAVTDRADGVRIVDDAYNANPDSMRAALRALGPLAAGGRRTVAVLGEMLELGEESAAEHRDLGREVARAGVDVLVAVAPGAAAVAAGAAEADPARAGDHAVADVDAAAALLAELVRPGDVVLFKGSNGSGIWRLADSFQEVGA